MFSLVINIIIIIVVISIIIIIMIIHIITIIITIEIDRRDHVWNPYKHFEEVYKGSPARRSPGTVIFTL